MTPGADAAVLERALRDLFRPPERLNVWEWAERHVSLAPPVPTPFPGPYRAAVTPYVRGPQEAYTDPAVHTVVVAFPTQSSKTLSTICLPLAYTLAADPGPAAVVMPSADMARSFSETRLQPLLRSAAVLRELEPEDPDRYKLLEMHYRTATVNLLGANSAGALSSRPVRYVFADEIDKYPPASAREADALSLLLERCKAFWNRKVVLTSTPTTPQGNLWRWWTRSDQRAFEVPCPHCGVYQVLEFDRLRWPEADKARISDLDDAGWVECIACNGEIRDRHKRPILEAGRWRRGSEDGMRGVAGFRIDALAVPWIKFGQVAAEFLRAKRFPDAYRNFLNSWRALPWDAEEQAAAGRAATVSVPAVLARPAAYVRGRPPAEAIFATAGIDVQGHEIWYVVRAWGRDDAAWLVDWGRRTVETDNLADFRAAVEAILAGDYGAPLLRAGIDSGWGRRTPEVYDLCRGHPVLVACKGRRSNRTAQSDGREIPLPPPRMVDRLPDGSAMRGAVALYTPSTSFFKRWLFGRVNADPPVWSWPAGLQDSEDGKTYLRHLESEQETTQRSAKTGAYQTFWVVRRGYEDNHLLDCEMMAAAARHIMLTGRTMDSIAASVAAVAAARKARMEARAAKTPAAGSNPYDRLGLYGPRKGG